MCCRPQGTFSQIPDSSSNSDISVNPLRYRGYYYDTDLEMYYLTSRYYDPVVGRFINGDAYLSTGQGVIGYNMFAYCGNNTVNRVDPTGTCFYNASGQWCHDNWEFLGGYQRQPEPLPRSDLATKPDLDINTASSGTYNCYGNGIRKQANARPSGYQSGDSTRKTFEAVKTDLGVKNVRELDSINSPIEADEFKVAMRCGPTDFHFIRQLDNGDWYNKSGLSTGMIVYSEYVINGPFGDGVWWANSVEFGITKPTYTYETIFFAVKIDWSE